MELPGALKAAVERELEGIPLAALQRAAATLSQRYRAETRDGRLHLDAELPVKAYLATRLPATYAAVRTSFEAVAEAVPDFAPSRMLDVGAGPGTALWAAADCWSSVGSAHMLEASNEARTIGARLSEQLPGIEADWRSADVSTGFERVEKADLVTMAYVLDELDPGTIPSLISHLWSLATTLIIVEPGTPAGWRRILKVRQQLIDAGAHIAAPCPHLETLPTRSARLVSLRPACRPQPRTPAGERRRRALRGREIHFRRRLAPTRGPAARPRACAATPVQGAG